MRNLRVLVVSGLLFGIAPTGSGQEPAVPASIVADGVPEIPRDLADALARYENYRSATFQGWLGGRREMLILTRFADTTQVHLVKQPGGARTQLTFLRERVLSAHPRGNRDQFLYVTDEGGGENFQFYLQDMATGRAVRLTDGKSRNTDPVWSHSGDLLAWSSNARNGKDMDLYVMAPSDPNLARRFKEVSGSWTVSDWSPDDRRVAAIEHISSSESYVDLIDLATGKTETLTPRPEPGEPTAFYDQVRWSEDGGWLFWITDQDSEYRQLERFPLAGGGPERLTEKLELDIEEFELLSPWGGILTVNDKGSSHVFHFRYYEGLDPRLFGDEKVTYQPLQGIGGSGGFRIAGARRLPLSNEFGFTLSNPKSPWDSYSFSFANSNLEKWTSSELGGIDRSKLPRVETDAFDSFDESGVTLKTTSVPGTDKTGIPALVYRPGSRDFPGRRPVLIEIHGGPEGQSRPEFLGWRNYLVNELGIVLILPNVRGSTGYGKSYLKLDDGKKREDAVNDIGKLLDWIKDQDDLDASRVAVMGGSYGGYMTLACLTHYSDRLKAGIDVVGISNFVTFLKSTSGYRRDLRRAEYGDERGPEMREFLDKISPLTNASKIKVPLLVAQGKNDPRVPASESDQIIAAVRKNGVPVWSVVARDEGHGFAKRKNQDYLHAAIVLFLKQYLVGAAPPS